MAQVDICNGEVFTFEGTNYTQSGDYTVDLTSKDGCDSVVVISLNFLEPIETSIQRTTCSNEPYVFAGESFSQTGSYPVVLQASNGCDSTVTLNLEVFESYDIDLGTVQVCQGASIDIGGFNLNQADTYTLPLMSKNGCDSILTVRVEIVEDILVDLGTIVLCEGESFLFSGTDISQSGMYSDTSVSSIGCDSITTVNIEMTPNLVISINNLIGSCEGGANGSFVIESVPGATPPFSVNGLNGISTIDQLPFTVSGLSTGTYSFDLIDANGCATSEQVVITDDREGVLTILSTEIDPQGMFELLIEYNGEIASIEWEDRDGLSCYDCPNPSVDIEETTTFKVTVVDVDGCITMAEITLVVDNIGNVYFPNIISPNSAFGNHRFFPQTDLLTSSAFYDLHVYDRWGNMVYEMLRAPVNDNSYGWNGRYSDNRINAGIFVYSVKVYKDNGNSKTFKGDLTVIE